MSANAARRNRKATTPIHPRFSLDDGERLHVVSALQLSDGVLLVDAGVELEPDTAITLVPLDADLSHDLYELRGRVLRTYPDILVSAYAENRYLISVELEHCPRHLGAAQQILEDGKGEKPHREYAEPHRESLLEVGFWTRTG